jgi:hypothetical protein
MKRWRMTNLEVIKGLENALKSWLLNPKDRELLREAIRLIKTLEG